MRILLVATHFIQYGIELSNALAAQGAEVGLAFRPQVAEKLIGPDWRRMLQPGVQLLEMPAGSTLKPWTRSAIRNLRWFKRTMREFKPDALHVQANVDFATIWTAWHAKVPLAVTIHDVTAHPGDEEHVPSRLENFVRKRVVPHARKKGTRFIVHGERLREDLHKVMGVARDDIDVIPHGILEGFRQRPGRSLEQRLADFPTPPEPPGPALMFGRMGRYKGLHVLREAIPMVHAQNPEIRFIIAGRGPALDQELAALEAMPKVELRNRYVATEEVDELYAQCGLNLVPYIEASQSGVIANGYAFGMPSVASRVGALPEVVVDGENGLLVEPEQPAALAEAILRFYADADLRARLRAGVRDWATDRLCWDEIAQKTLETYQRLGRKE